MRDELIMPKTKKTTDPIANLAQKPAYSPDLIALPPIFTDTDRRKRVEAALPAVESLLMAVQNRKHIPGLAYGVVLDGELIAAKGLKRGVRQRRPADRGRGVAKPDQPWD